jgi:hypothetical protein
MEITVSEHILSFASEYDITTPCGDYRARKEIFSFTDRIHLTAAGGAELARIEGEISPLRHKHEFFLNDGHTYRFECEKLWKQVYTCEGDGESYHLIEHHGLK